MTEQIPMIARGAVLARLAALKIATTPALKQEWRVLFSVEPPPYNRRFLELRLAYRIQELAFGGLKPETVARLKALGEQFSNGNVTVRRMQRDDRPLIGTRLVREYQGTPHTVMVRTGNFEYQGAPTNRCSRSRGTSPAQGGTGCCSSDCAAEGTRHDARANRRCNHAGHGPQAAMRDLHP